MSIKLRDLIRNIRSCKTAAEERSVVAKECALIRTAFKEEDNIYRHRNVAKLLFINMLGYPTHFGQIECLKLIASNKFSFKRIGYLGLTILLDENTDILMLVTNSIKNDLRNSNQYINGLALCALGNIANSEMCSSLRYEILDMMNINNPYIKKKAAMCAIRILKKTNDIEELFLEKINNLLDDRNHGVLSAGISLMITLMEKKPQYKNILRGYTNKIVKILKSCVMSGYTHGAEYDIYGINDPFLQVKILKLLKYLNSDHVNNNENENENENEKHINYTNNMNNKNDEDNKTICNINYEGATTSFNNTKSFNEQNDILDDTSLSSREKLIKNVNNKQPYSINDNMNKFNSMNIIHMDSMNNNIYDMEEVNSVLAQVATNTDSLKNVGNAILYECVKTITYISTDPGLLVLAVNVLGKFLQNNDNNIRYVGLCTLQKLLKKDPKTLHIYRNTIIECLKDQDISIRKKALDVAFALITKDSLKIMVKELLNYLLVADIEIKSDIVSNICVSVNKYAPNVQYLLDTYIKLFCLAGNFIQDHIKDDFIYYLLQNPEFHSYVVFKIFFSIKENLDQYALIQVGIWCIGEFGDLLIQEKNVGPDEELITVTHEDVFDLLDKIIIKYEQNHVKELHNINVKDPIHNILYNNKSLNILEETLNNNSNINGNNTTTNHNNHNNNNNNNNGLNNALICCNINDNMNNDDNNIILQYILMCLNKLTVRFPSHKNKIEKMIQKYKKNKCIEIQQRACEFHEFMNPQWDQIRDSILLRIPCNKKMNRKKQQQQQQEQNDDAEEPIYSDKNTDTLINKMSSIHTNNHNNSNNSYVVDLLDLDDVLGIQNTNNKNNDNMNKNINNNLTINENKLNNFNITNDPIKMNIPSVSKSEANINISSNTLNINDNNVQMGNKENEDILADLFGNISLDKPTSNKPSESKEEGNNSLNLLLDDITTDNLDTLNLMDEKIKEKVQIQPLKIYDKNDIVIVFNFEKEYIDSEVTMIKAVYSNKSSILISSFVFEAVVPNYVKLEIFSASDKQLLPSEGNTIKQNLKIWNKLFKKKPVLMKVRLSYVKNNESFQDFINIGNFPNDL
ncbi:AP-1 complex subunit gamma, putative [Plasmodium reichenowi]|uniref:AP-1 complex subunit gamma, putative n=1 Tax=Plasmodium reichenowi TaxID=5854 RepID=A0A2P9DQA1_PLARE|nr:AP-1 complex subunit gamma, putative [Plasmodium reichenowi]